MCGLAGLWTTTAYRDDIALEERASSMGRALAHRGPDDHASWCDPEVGIALAFRRLAILDRSEAGRQPMISPDGRWVLVFNGEIYNYRELRTEFIRAGRAFQGTSDTEVILHAAMRWGALGMLPHLWGMFALALWDRDQRHLMLACDRLGKKPMYYGRQSGALLFGSELVALRAHPTFQAAIDRSALTTYIRFGYVPAPRSIYEGVHKVSPGTAVIFRTAESQGDAVAYWQPFEIARRTFAQRRAPVSQAEAVDQLEALLQDAVARRMIADVPVGAFLSGGIDSATIVALMQAQSSRPVRTFTVGFGGAGVDEAPFAKCVAEYLGTDHTELYLTPDDALAFVPRLPRVYAEPFADTSQIPTFAIAYLASQHVTVTLSGDGGDEIFGGYNRYVWADTLQRNLVHASASLVTSAATRNFDRFMPLLRRESAAAAYTSMRSAWNDPSAVVIGGQDTHDPLGVHLARAVTPNIVEWMPLVDLVTYLPGDILVKVDRATMHVSLEARAPLLDHRVIEWRWGLPAEYDIQHGHGKWLLRQVLNRYLPQTLFDRPKNGFSPPIANWLCTGLRNWAEALLAPSRLHREGYFNPDIVRKTWDAHLARERNAGHALWIILMFQAWLEVTRRHESAVDQSCTQVGRPDPSSSV